MTANAVEALKQDFDVSLLAWEPFDLATINRTFGTKLSAKDFKLLTSPAFLRLFEKINPYFSAFRSGIILRMAKKMRKDFDVLFSLHNEADFGCRGLQYIHDPPYYLSLSSRPSPRLVIPNQMWALFKGRQRPWMIVAGYSHERMMTNVTLVNSHWTQNQLRGIYGIESRVVSPPVAGNFLDVPWENRENGFVCIGRFSPVKELEKVCRIITMVRKQIPDVHLHMVGTSWKRGYVKTLLRQISDSPWITMHQDVSRRELLHLISTHRYGIHGMVNESFGLAVAEMMKGGCIVFVPRSGGPSEVVGADERTLYDSEGDATSKIIAVLKDPEMQNSIRRFLEGRRDLYSQESFFGQIQEVVRQFPRQAV